MTQKEAEVEATSKMAQKIEKDKLGRQRGQKKEKLKAPTKIIIRRLPPSMTEEEFLKQVDPLPDHDFFYYVTADWSLGYDATCRAYLTLKKYEDVFIFRDRFDSYVFVDSKGAEYPAIVEFAPFQGLLKNKSRRSDNKVNTIAEESHYQQFLLKLEEDREIAAKGGECKLEFSLDRKKEEKITSTPLLQYLANKKEKRREEAKKRYDEKKRKREEEKDKRQQGQSQTPKLLVTKIASSQNVALTESKESVDDKNSNGQDRKSSRKKRSTLRGIRRKEEYQQRKKDQQRTDLEQKKSGTSAESGQDQVKETNANDVINMEEPQQADDGKDRRDGKRGNDRRERNRNRKDKEKSKGGDVKERVSEENVKKNKLENDKNEEINEAVKNFIMTAASVQENNKVKEKQSNDSSDLGTSKKSETKGSKICNDKEKQAKEQKLREERRIRNKDRPSIAIYTPKPRVRASEESDSNANKDVRSNPTSDCEGVKKDESRPKKVSRYSERRAERRGNKEKRKSHEGIDMEEASADNVPVELRKSKSSDDAGECETKTFESS